MSSFLATVTNLFETDSSDESTTELSEVRLRQKAGEKEETSSNDSNVAHGSEGEDTFEDLDEVELKQPPVSSKPLKKVILNRAVLDEVYGKKLYGQTAFLQDEIRRLKDENVGLKDVWMKSREKLKRMKVVLDTKEELHESKIEQLLDEKESEIDIYRNLIAEKESETRSAHDEVKTLLSTHALRIQQLSDDEKNKEMSKEELRKTVQRIKEQRQELLRQQKYIVEAHKQQIEAMREQLERQTELHEQEKRNQDIRTTSLYSHAESLEEHQAEYTVVMAKTEHEYQVTSLENKRLKDENRSMKLDHLALKAESESHQARIKLLEEDLRSTASQLKLADEGNSKLEHAIELQRDRGKDDVLMLQQKLSVSETLRLSEGTDTDFTRATRAKLSELREDLFLLRSKYQQVWSEKTELSVLLQQRRAQLATLSANVRHLQEKERDVERRGFSMRRINPNLMYLGLESKYGKVGVTILRVVDNCGQLLARCIFTNLIPRMGFVVYLICFHLFLFGYMFVYIHMDLDGVSKSNQLTSAVLAPTG